jgi:thiamine transporter
MKNTKKLAMSAMLVALSAVLAVISMMVPLQLPFGGSVTLASMLPIMLISVKYGIKIGLPTAFVYSLLQLLQAFMEGDVFPYCETILTFTVCLLFDYVVPFTILGISGVFKNTKLFKNKEIAVYVGITLAVVLRFFCHFITGVAIWGQWAPEGMGKFLYSFLYNGSFLSVDFAICLVLAVLMMRESEIRKLVNLEK